MSQPKTAEEWAATLKSRPSYELGEGLTYIALTVEDRDAIAALLARLSNQVEARTDLLRRIKDGGWIRQDDFARTCLCYNQIIDDIDAALQEPKS